MTTATLGIVAPIDHAAHPARVVDLARHCEAAGVASFSCGELASYDAMAMLAAVAASTTRVELATTVVSLVARSTPLLAMGAATLAHVSDGRFRLGVGVGSATIASWHDRELVHPASMMRERLVELRAALAGERLSSHGSFRLATDRAEVPLDVAALNPVMLALAGELADGVVLTMSGPRDVATMTELVAAAAERARRATPRVIATNWLYSAHDPERGRAHVRRSVAPYFGVAAYQRAVTALAGERGAAAIARALREGGRDAAAALIPDEVVDEISVVATRDALIQRREALANAGANAVNFVLVGSTPVSWEELVDVVGEMTTVPSTTSERATSTA